MPNLSQWGDFGYEWDSAMSKTVTLQGASSFRHPNFAGVTQLAECRLSKPDVEGSTPFARFGAMVPPEAYGQSKQFMTLPSLHGARAMTSTRMGLRRAQALRDLTQDLLHGLTNGARFVAHGHCIRRNIRGWAIS